MYHYQETVSHSLIIRRKRLDLDLSTHGTEKPTTTRNLPDPRNTSSLLTVYTFPHKSANQASYSFLQLFSASYSFSQLLTASFSFSQLLTASYSFLRLLTAWIHFLVRCQQLDDGNYGENCVNCLQTEAEETPRHDQTITFSDKRLGLFVIQDTRYFLPRCHSQCFSRF